MKRKQGISLVMVIAAVVIMLVLISSAAVVGSNAIDSANFDEYILSVSRVSDLVNEYFLNNNNLPVTADVVNISSLPNEFKQQLVNNND